MTQFFEKGRKYIETGIKHIQKVKDDITGKSTKDELAKYFKIFEAILSGMDTKISEVEKTSTNNQEVIKTLKSEQTEIKEKLQAFSDKLRETLADCQLVKEKLKVFSDEQSQNKPICNCKESPKTLIYFALVLGILSFALGILSLALSSY